MLFNCKSEIIINVNLLFCRYFCAIVSYFYFISWIFIILKFIIIIIIIIIKYRRIWKVISVVLGRHFFH